MLVARRGCVLTDTEIGHQLRIVAFFDAVRRNEEVEQVFNPARVALDGDVVDLLSRVALPNLQPSQWATASI